MAKNKRKSGHQKPRNMVHICMVEQHKPVAHKSDKDYDRNQLKQQLKREDYD